MPVICPGGILIFRPVYIVRDVVSLMLVRNYLCAEMCVCCKVCGATCVWYNMCVVQCVCGAMCVWCYMCVLQCVCGTMCVWCHSIQQVGDAYEKTISNIISHQMNENRLSSIQSNLFHSSFIQTLQHATLH